MSKTYATQQKSELVNEAKSLVKRIAKLEELTYEIRIHSPEFDHYRTDELKAQHPEEMQMLDEETRTMLVQYASEGIRKRIAELKARLGGVIFEACRYGADVFKLEIDPKFMYPSSREEYMKRKAGKEVTLPQAQIIDIVRDLLAKAREDYVDGLKKNGGRAHSTIRLEGAKNALDAVIVLLEEEGLL